MVFSSKGLINGINGYAEINLPVLEDAPLGTVNSGAELVEACGIYIDDEFIGAVADKDSIETQLETILNEYLEMKLLLRQIMQLSLILNRVFTVQKLLLMNRI